MPSILPNWKPIRWASFFAGIISVFFLSGIGLLIFLSIDLQRSDKALVVATVVGSMGTLLLAIATLANVFQTNKNIELKDKERERPLVIEELSSLIQPAINALKGNRGFIESSSNRGCAYDWIYVDVESFGSQSVGPRKIDTSNSFAMARLAGEDKWIYTGIQLLNNHVGDVAREAEKLHLELKPEIQRLLEEEGFQEIEQSPKVITSAVLKELEHFGESHELYEFWESNGEHLIEFANDQTETTQQSVKAAENVYCRYMVEFLKELELRKAELKQEYGVSEEDIISEGENSVIRVGD